MSTIPSEMIDIEGLFSDDALPSLPQSAVCLLELSHGPENGPNEFAIPIQADPGLAGQVLRFVNSSFFGFSQEVSTVTRALQLVGVPTIKNFALWCAVFSLMPESIMPEFDLKALWQDSLRRGTFARELAKRLKAKDDEEAFIGGLLQDMALPVLAKQKPELYAKCFAVRDEKHVRISALEQHVLKTDHADIGNRLARYWKLPKAICDLIASHAKSPDEDPELLKSPNKMAVILSALLPSSTETEWNEYHQFRKLLGQLKLDPATELSTLLERTDTAFCDFAPVLQVSSNIKTLAEFLSDIEGEPS